MRIRSIRIRNFRVFEDVEIEMLDYVALVGPNGAGKSTVLAALNIFFRQVEDVSTNVRDLSEEDFHNKNTKEPIEITVTFDELGDAAKDEFRGYVRHDRLSITAAATFDPSSKIATVHQYGERFVVSEFAPFFEAEKAKASVADLRLIYAGLMEKFPDLQAETVKAKMVDALRDFEEVNPDQCNLERSKDQFYGFTGGADRLQKFVKWLYIPAVKDATKENVEAKNTALGQLLNFTVRSKVDFAKEIEIIREETRTKYQSLLDSQQDALNDLSKALTSRLTALAHSSSKAELEWTEDQIRSVQIADPTAKLVATEGKFSGDIARFGHGFQRCYLLALLQELASLNLEHNPTLILGIEEPELYQHPPQARHLASVIEELSKGNSQIFVTTHSPYFVTGRYFENVYAVKGGYEIAQSTVHCVKMEDVAEVVRVAKDEKKALHLTAQSARLEQALNPQVNEIFFCRAVVLVEGMEDEAILTTWMMLSGMWEEFRSLGGHIVEVSGKSNLLVPIVLCSQISIPAFAMFDSDGGETHTERRKLHERDNRQTLRALKIDEPTAFPSTDIFAERYIQWKTDFYTRLRSDIEPKVWDKCYQTTRKKLGEPSGSFMKNPVFIGEFVAELKKAGISVACLDEAGDRILSFLRKAG